MRRVTRLGVVLKDDITSHQDNEGMELRKKNNGKKRMSQRGVVLLWPCVLDPQYSYSSLQRTITSPPERVCVCYAQQ